MRWRDALELAARSVLRRPGRAALTLLSVALATALLTALLTIADTAETRVLDELAEGGPISAIQVAAAEAQPGQVEQDDLDAGEEKDLDEAAAQAIAEIPDVRAVLPVLTTPVFVDRPAEQADGTPLDPFQDEIVGVDLSRPGLLPVTVLEGRLPAPSSLTEVAVSQQLLERLGLDPAQADQVVGTEVRLAAGRLFAEADEPPQVRGRWVRLQVVGVVAQEAGTGQLLVPLEQAQAARDWTRSGIDGGEQLGAGASDLTGLVVVAEGIDQVSEVRAAIDDIGYATSAPENVVASVRNYLGVVDIVLTSVGAIALVVAALGIANALLAAVRERQREIGVLKAIGARDRDVLAVFVVEAGVLGFLGGALGTAMGAAVAGGVGELVNRYLVEQGLATVSLRLSPPIIVGGVLGATVLALVGGVVPAWRAARLPARDAVVGG
ncbi:ABC transporter permease [Iamia majanohamensis]|uniref:ABC transporter permease n=1 Tax=Iamia majanohamensis TaxID=467976 RepID=A0AAF0BV16_9ACTN|nr:ABC transporter permease [Iamia majanohamensis]WCO65964.1 ABC transporter permease [Iamia majanohamensis]